MHVGTVGKGMTCWQLMILSFNYFLKLLLTVSRISTDTDKQVCPYHPVKCSDVCIAVNKDGVPYTDYENCKGCMICSVDVSIKVIERVRELPVW